MSNIEISNCLQPIISVIIPCYNHGKYITEAIDSIEKSTRKDFEIIIINDGSTDKETIDQLEVFNKKGYIVLNQINKGAMNARNNGIKISKGKYVLPLDADNLIYPEMISKSVELMENDSSISIVYSDRMLFGERNGLIKVGTFNLPLMLIENQIDTCAVFRKEVWIKTGGYDENMPMQGWEDWDFWLTSYSLGFNFAYLPEPLFQYRVSVSSAIQNLMNSERLDEMKKYLMTKHVLLLNKEYKKLLERYNKYDALLKILENHNKTILYRIAKFIYKKRPRC